MQYEKSCGAVVFTKIGTDIRYLLVSNLNGFYGFPKGHIEGTESEIETALREISEETGLTVRLIDGFRTEDTHSFMRNSEARLKHIVYFLAEYSDQVPTAQEAELSSVHLMDYETAISVFQFESSKRLLTEAHNFLMRQ